MLEEADHCEDIRCNDRCELGAGSDHVSARHHIHNGLQRHGHGRRGQLSERDFRYAPDRAGATQTTNTVSVAIGGVTVPQANVVFSGLVGAGLYQLNIVLPSNLGSGDKAIVATVGGAQTQSGVMLSLQ